MFQILIVLTFLITPHAAYLLSNLQNGLKLAFPFPFWQLHKTPIMPAPHNFYTKSKPNAGPHLILHSYTQKVLTCNNKLIKSWILASSYGRCNLESELICMQFDHTPGTYRGSPLGELLTWVWLHLIKLCFLSFGNVYITIHKNKQSTPIYLSHSDHSIASQISMHSRKRQLLVKLVEKLMGTE